MTASSAMDSNDKSVFVICPAGKIVVAGGWFVSSQTNTAADNLVVRRNVNAWADTPFFTTSWLVAAVESSPIQQNWQLTAFATCAFPT